MNPVIERDGTKKWFNKYGLHRTDGPALENIKKRYKSWYQNGKRHRTDGPAIEYPDGSNSWYLNGVRHRTDGPAVIYENGSKEWYQNGVMHRTDGPARELADGDKSWFLNGKWISEDLFLKITKGPVKKLPLYMGMGYDQFISERMKNGT